MAARPVEVPRAALPAALALPFLQHDASHPAQREVLRHLVQQLRRRRAPPAVPPGSQRPVQDCGCAAHQPVRPGPHRIHLPGAPLGVGVSRIGTMSMPAEEADEDFARDIVTAATFLSLAGTFALARVRPSREKARARRGRRNGAFACVQRSAARTRLVLRHEGGGAGGTRLASTPNERPNTDASARAETMGHELWCTGKERLF